MRSMNSGLVNVTGGLEITSLHEYPTFPREHAFCASEESVMEIESAYEQFEATLINDYLADLFAINDAILTEMEERLSA